MVQNLELKEMADGSKLEEARTEIQGLQQELELQREHSQAQVEMLQEEVRRLKEAPSLHEENKSL